VYRVCIYEKGKQLGLDPNWVRVESRLKPQSRDKPRYSVADPQQIAYATPWGRELWDALGHLAPDRIIQATPPVERNLENRTLCLIAQYGRVILDLAEHHAGDLEQLGRHLVQAAIANRYESRAAASKASAFFFTDGDTL
jgi:DNA relaxase NicK